MDDADARVCVPEGALLPGVTGVRGKETVHALWKLTLLFLPIRKGRAHIATARQLCDSDMDSFVEAV